ncbi:unnamed protein product [Bursaphelenchus xylophilus]|uniref:(pine wood nematode) hypothetical protein n=1 Tax=Bursaphelenchus xylophilus TaxID=6326 RepID=A0A1I7S451_BURXY|nr:unnamed protein product [Bursaphelenchus xylophilus]CAG9116727.1 unnamed protein product [Bursaphelenchus xylophilus]
MSLAQILAGNGDSGAQSPPDYLLNAPVEVRNRVQALKGLHLDTIDVQVEFYKRVHELEVEFRSKYEKINEKRAQIVNGTVEPTEEEVKREPLLTYLDEEATKKFEESAPVTGGEKVKGIPSFWLNVLKNVPQIDELISEDDEAVLQYLKDIKAGMTSNPDGFTVTFYFDENPYFTNTELKKEYTLSIGPNKFEQKVLYDGPSVVKTTQCKIDWKEGKNVTQKVLKKKQKKGPNAGRVTVKTVEQPSFFNLFNPAHTEISEDLPDDEAELLNADFEIGQLIRDTIVDNAVLYYTGEITDEDDGFDYDAEDFEDDEDEEEEE